MSFVTSILVGDSGFPRPVLLVAIAMACMGLYFMVGRFAYKAWRKKQTYYAVTDRRVLAATGAASKSVSAVFLRDTPVVNKSVGRDGVGTIVFGDSSGIAAWYGNTGMEWMSAGHGAMPLAFYDIHEASTVYELVNRLRNEAGGD